MTLDEIRAAFAAHDLDGDDPVPDVPLRAAMQQVDALAPEVLSLTDHFNAGVNLTPDEVRQMVFGMHVLAAARHPGLLQRLDALIRQHDYDLDDVFFATAAEIIASMYLCVWDGDADRLVQAIVHGDLSDAGRRALLGVLQDRAIAGQVSSGQAVRCLQDMTADPEADIWLAWVETAIGARLQALAIAVRARVNDPEFIAPDAFDPDSMSDAAFATPPERNPLVAAFDDPVAAFGWVEVKRKHSEEFEGIMAELAADERVSVDTLKASGDLDDVSDETPPPGTSPLTAAEIAWLNNVAARPELEGDALSFEAIDAVLTAALIGPVQLDMKAVIPELLGPQDETKSLFKTEAQVKYWLDLVVRHFEAIAGRLMAEMPLCPYLDPSAPDEFQGSDWGYGFALGMEYGGEAWSPLFEAEYVNACLFKITDLDPETADENGGKPPTLNQRQATLDALPELLETVRDAAVAIRTGRKALPALSTKIGRNDPCPCGSGKKYKKCCADKPVTLH